MLIYTNQSAIVERSNYRVFAMSVIIYFMAVCQHCTSSNHLERIMTCSGRKAARYDKGLMYRDFFQSSIDQYRFSRGEILLVESLGLSCEPTKGLRRLACKVIANISMSDESL